jgi:hypothetical protein
MIKNMGCNPNVAAVHDCASYYADAESIRQGLILPNESATGVPLQKRRAVQLET